MESAGSPSSLVISFTVYFAMVRRLFSCFLAPRLTGSSFYPVDMGLGKTLQSICILASMHHERAQRHEATKSPDTVHLPSVIICPPTLTGHWKQEINTYAKALRCVIYTGPRIDRERLVRSFKKYDAVITSYDIARNDVEALSKIDWHYCILDEGHIIKNGKTKLTKAVKSLKSIHRLILSGTPIQNNVLELWSLFDFLMPGFLGSEKAFNERFGKPIAASRDAKSSSKEQEAGAAALEALPSKSSPSSFVDSKKTFSTTSLRRSFKTTMSNSLPFRNNFTTISRHLRSETLSREKLVARRAIRNLSTSSRPSNTSANSLIILSSSTNPKFRNIKPPCSKYRPMRQIFETFSMHQS